MRIPFRQTMTPRYGEAQPITPRLTRVLAQNPSLFTFYGTGSLIVGSSDSHALAVVDPGPDDPNHLAALCNALSGRRVSHILITHTHSDHCAGARRFASMMDAPILGYGPHPLWEGQETATDEEGDAAFAPDVIIGDGTVIEGAGWTLEALHTPGHISNHLCFALREDNALLTGDHVMGWSTSIVSPPEGHMGDYIAQLHRLLARSENLYVPTHGLEITDPKPFLEALILHRESREARIKAALSGGPANALALTPQVYADTPAALHGAAARSLLAHLIHLTEKGEAECAGIPSLRAIFRLV